MFETVMQIIGHMLVLGVIFIVGRLTGRAVSKRRLPKAIHVLMVAGTGLFLLVAGSRAVLGPDATIGAALCGMAALLGFLYGLPQQAKPAESAEQPQPGIPPCVSERLAQDGWTLEWAQPNILLVYKKGLGEDHFLPGIVIRELDEAGWSVRYVGARLLPPPWWVSTEPIELGGYYQIDRL